MNLLEMSKSESAGSVFHTALKSGVCCEVCLDWALLNWLEDVLPSWKGRLPTIRNLKLKDLINIIAAEDCWYEDDLMLNIGIMARDYAKFWYYGERPDKCGNASCVA